MTRLLFRLCLELGYPHPDHLLLELNSRQIQEWLIYFEDRPFGHDIRDVQLARIAALISASAGVKTTIDQHLPWKKDDTPQNPESTLAQMPGAAAFQQQLEQVAGGSNADNSQSVDPAGSENRRG